MTMMKLILLNTNQVPYKLFIVKSNNLIIKEY